MRHRGEMPIEDCYHLFRGVMVAVGGEAPHIRKENGDIPADPPQPRLFRIRQKAVHHLTGNITGKKGPGAAALHFRADKVCNRIVSVDQKNS